MFKKILPVLFSFLFLSFFASISYADETKIKAKLVKQLTGVIGGIEQAQITNTPIKGIYEIVLGQEVVYISEDGLYLFQGDIFSLRLGKNLTKIRANSLVANALKIIDDKDKIIFKAKNQKYSIDVFTDVDCPFCQKLHTQIPKLNELGVTVKYMASPLASLHPDALAKMKSIWCANGNEARKTALDNYKRFRKYQKKSCDSTIVEQQLALAQKLGVNGTPSIFFSDGSNIPGYRPAERLIVDIRKAANSI